jgi:hypothetical protein
MVFLYYDVVLIAKHCRSQMFFCRPYGTRSIFRSATQDLRPGLTIFRPSGTEACSQQMIHLAEMIVGPAKS